MSTDSDMDFEEELFPLVGRDALHEYSRWTLLVKFVTNGNECLGASSDSSCFGLFRWENLLEEVGEQWYSLVDHIKCHHGEVGERHCHGGANIGPPEHLVEVGARRGGQSPLGTRLVLEWVWVRYSRMRVDGLWRSLMKTPSRDGTRLVANFATKLAASLSFQGHDVV